MFSAVYPTAVAEHTFQLLDKPRTITGRTTHRELRLHLVPWVACLILAVFLGLVIVAVLHALYACQHNTSLREEPNGLIS